MILEPVIIWGRGARCSGEAWLPLQLLGTGRPHSSGQRCWVWRKPPDGMWAAGFIKLAMAMLCAWPWLCYAHGHGYAMRIGHKPHAARLSL